MKQQKPIWKDQEVLYDMPMALHSPNDYNLRVELSQNFSLSLIVVEVGAPDSRNQNNTALTGIRRVFSEKLVSAEFVAERMELPQLRI